MALKSTAYSQEMKVEKRKTSNNLNLLRTDTYLHYIQSFSSYLQRTQSVTIVKTNHLRMFRDIIIVYCENDTKHKKHIVWRNFKFVSVIVIDTFSYQQALSG